MPILHGRSVVLRPIRSADVESLTAILAEPAIARWWGVFDRARVEREFLHDDEAGVEHYAIELDGRVIGAIQSSEESDPDYRHAGIDLFLSTAVHGRGLGTDAIGTLAAHLIDDRGHHRLTIDPALGNERAIRVYERLGFRRVGILRSYERAPEGTWRDCLLMDLLSDELVRVPSPPGAHSGS